MSILNPSPLVDYDIYTDSLSALVDECLDVAANSRRCAILSCINPHSYVVAQEDPYFDGALRASDWLIADGIGLTLGYKFVVNQELSWIPGPDFFRLAMDRLNSLGGSVGFFGSDSDTLAKLRAFLSVRYPQVEIAVMIAPPFASAFSEEEEGIFVTQINLANVDVLWVGMTAPKQEKWLRKNREKLHVGLAASVGAVFDFESGKMARAPIWMRRCGLEWLHRFIFFPRKMWRRIFVSGPKFFATLCVQLLRK